MAKNMNSKNSLLKFRKNSLTNYNSNSFMKDNQAKNEQQPKKYLRETGFNQIINEMIITTCQKYMEFDLKKRLIIYGCFVLIGSLLCGATPNLLKIIVPYKTEKSSILNVYFVKWGWLWTLIFWIPFVCLIRKSINNTMSWYNFKDLFRVLITSLIWYLSIALFNYVESSTSKCNQLSIKSKSECLRKGWGWSGFDISGHTFLLLFSNLILFEESKAMNGFENFGYLLDNKNQESNKINNQNYDHYNMYSKLLVPVRILYILMTILAIIWDFMLFQTVLFYHDFLQKMIAFFWSLAVWYLCYRVIFPFDLFNLMPLKTPAEIQEN